MKKSFILGTLMLAGLASAQDRMASSGSLFDPSTATSPISGRTARKKGDLLTIRVRETMKGQHTASKTSSKAASGSLDKISLPVLDVFAGPLLGKVFGGVANKLISGVTGATTLAGKSADTGAGVTISSTDLTASLTVVVTDVDANGNLHIAGVREVMMDKEAQKLVLTGIVRADDILPTNEIPSDRIANADIKAEGKGSIADKTRPGFLTKILNWLL